MTAKLPLWVFPVASLILPGVGQLLQQRTSRGVLLLVLAVVLAATVLLYLGVVLYAVWDAYSYEVSLSNPMANLTESEWRRVQHRQRNHPVRRSRDAWEADSRIGEENERDQRGSESE